MGYFFIGNCFCMCKELARINDHNRPSLFFYLFNERNPPGKTAKRFVSSRRAREEISIDVAAVNDRKLDVSRGYIRRGIYDA